MQQATRSEPAKDRVDSLTLVTGATGSQGGATASALLAAGHRVRVLARDPGSPQALALASRGAEIARGDFDDAASLAAALRGISAVFSVQLPDAHGTDAERRHGYALVKAAREAGVRHYVHTSVCEAGRHTGFPRWQSGYWWQKYWTDKWDVEQAVRDAGFERLTVLRPAFLMDNFAQPKAQFMFPHLRQGQLLAALLPTTRLQLIAADDVGAFACAAIDHPARFDRTHIELAAEALTLEEIAAALSRGTRKQISARSVTPEEARAAGLFAGWIRSQEWTNEVGYRADIASLGSYGMPLTSFSNWIERHVHEIVIET